MKNLMAVIFIFCCLYSKGQTLPDFNLIKLEKPADYKTAEPFALQTARYLLSTPLKKDDAERLNSLRFIGKWMFGTPDYSFVFTEVGDKIGKDNDLLGVYMAALAKYTLENKAAAKDQKVAKLNALVLLLDYCGQKDNNCRMTKQLKKLAEAKEKGQLEQAFFN